MGCSSYLDGCRKSCPLPVFDRQTLQLLPSTLRTKLYWPTHYKRILILYVMLCGPGSSVGIATGYGLDGPGIESRWGARFFAPVQTGLGAHPSSCTMGMGFFPGVKSGRGLMLTPHSLLVSWS